jgi:pimeloyl-ACP methyl ester carboxylesterase
VIRRISLVALALLALAACSGGGGAAQRTPSPSPSASAPSSAAVSTSPSGVSSAAPASASPVAWERCPAGFDISSKAQCAILRVPLDRSGKVSGEVPLQLARRSAGKPAQRIGSLLLNPGGPGASTVDSFDFLYDQLSATIRDRFDIVGWDPRGVGHSAPVRCVDDRTLDRLLAASPDLHTTEGLQQVQTDAQTYVKGCERRSGKLLPFIGTLDTAKDMDAVRTAVGDDKATFLGFSYGTELGYAYASLFPERVRALVLDGAVDPTLSLLDHGRSQTIGFQKALDAFLADCASSRSCAWKLTGDAHAAYRELKDKVQASPLPARDTSRVLTESLFVAGVAAALYSKDSWQYLQQGLEAARNGDGTVMLFLSDQLTGRHDDGTYDNLQDAFTTISCRDEPVPDGLKPWLDAAAALKPQAPDFAEEGTVAPTGPGYPCSLFTSRPAAAALPPSITAPPALIVGTTGDPATPFAEAQGMTKAYAGSVLLTRKGEGHTGYGDSACVRKHADRFLLEQVLPPAGTVCTS